LTAINGDHHLPTAIVLELIGISHVHRSRDARGATDERSEARRFR
jgi:hypothetical protein